MEITMSDNAKRIAPLPVIERPDEYEPGSLPVEPDQGVVPSGIPEDPERGRLVDPEQSGQS
jgi:hypothetical protein